MVIRIHHTGRLAGVLFLILQLAACSYTVQSTRLLESLPAGLPLKWELEATPFFPQERYQCGPAALATLLVERGIAVTPDELVAQVYLPARQGSVTVEMEATARQYDMLVYPLSPMLETVLQEVAAGNPVLVLQNLGLSWWPRWHYAVVVGYDLDTASMILRSGVTRRYVMPIGVFETTWRRGDNWARIILPPDKLPQSAEPLPYVQAALSLEQSQREQAALLSYRSATTRWPTSALAWMARGNLAYRLGMFDEAEGSFRGGLMASPEDGAMWNNLGYALAAQGCRQQALLAVGCALALAPDNLDYRQSLAELQEGTSAVQDCEPVVCPVMIESRNTQGVAGALSSTP